MRKTIHSRLLAPLLVLAFLVSGSALAGGLKMYAFDPANFNDPTTIDNEYWPLIPGTFFVYFAETEDGCEWNIVDVTEDTYTVAAGVTGVVVLDMVWLVENDDCSEDDHDGADYVPGSFDFDMLAAGDMKEFTYDWYAQDDAGNIWYLGEATWEYEWDECETVVSVSPTGVVGCMDGSFEAGTPMAFNPEENAQAGLIMLADPAKGDYYQQELDEDNAEDYAKVLNFVPLDDEEGCLKTKEWTPLDPGAVEHKFYCPGEDGETDGLNLLVEETSGGRKVLVELVYVGHY